MTDPRPVVLIHGAWQGSWAFGRWMPMLAAEGWDVHAVDLPGNGCDPRDDTRAEDVCLDLYVSHVVDLLRTLDCPAILVGHSGGGVVATQVAAEVPELVDSVVFLAGMMLPSGWSYGDALGEFGRLRPDVPVRGVEPWLVRSTDEVSTRVQVQVATELFLSDAGRSEAYAAARQLTWQPEAGRVIRPSWRPDLWSMVRRIYIEALEDRSTPIEVQRFFQSLTPGAEVHQVVSGHVPQMTQPERLTEIFAQAFGPDRVDAMAAVSQAR